jgi:hypothetical protein
MLKQIKKTLAVLLAVCFLATVTIGAVSAHPDNGPHNFVPEEVHHHQHNIVHKPLPPMDHPEPRHIHVPALEHVPAPRP